MPTLIIVDFFQKLSIDSKIKCLRVHSYLYDLAHPAITTYGNFLQSAQFFFQSLERLTLSPPKDVVVIKVNLVYFIILKIF